MQNLKSLSNLLTQPVLGANDNTLAMVGKTQVELYSWDAVTDDMLKEIDEPQRKLLRRELLTDSKQD